MKLFALIALSGAIFAADPPVTTTFRESNALFANPGIGWMTGNPNVPTARFPYAVTYFRLNWMELEPADGVFDWRAIDTRIEAARGRGMKIAFRIMTANAHSRGYYSSPKWLFDAGCKSFVYTAGGDDPTSGGAPIPRIEPDYSDPLYLSRHARFLAALGKRYDGSPDIQFLDIGSYGIWGEWHTKHPVAIEVRRKIIDMYTAAFPRTPLAMMSDDDEALGYALQHGAGMRRDGIGSPWHEQNWIGSKKYAKVAGMADAWKSAPVVFEWFGDYPYLVRKGWPLDRALQFMLANHVSLINDNIGAVPPEILPQFAELTRRAGYRFVLREASHTPSAKRGSPIAMKMKWANVGVAKLYSPYALELSLLDSDNRVVSRSRTTIDPRTWLPGELSCEAPLPLPADLKPGVYGIGVAFVDAAGTPSIRLAVSLPDRDLRYRIGEVTVFP